MTHDNPFGKYNGRELEYLSQFLDTEDRRFKQINWVNRFETEFAKRFGSKFAVAVNSATSGLHAALIASGVRPGDEVISPAITVIMDSLVTQACGANIVYADVDPNTFNVTRQTIEPKISSKTKAIIVFVWSTGRHRPYYGTRKSA